jgi:hypothetical protein
MTKKTEDENAENNKEESIFENDNKDLIKIDKSTNKILEKIKIDTAMASKNLMLIAVLTVTTVWTLTKLATLIGKTFEFLNAWRNTDRIITEGKAAVDAKTKETMDTLKVTNPEAFNESKTQLDQEIEVAKEKANPLKIAQYQSGGSLEFTEEEQRILDLAKINPDSGDYAYKQLQIAQELKDKAEITPNFAGNGSVLNEVVNESSNDSDANKILQTANSLKRENNNENNNNNVPIIIQAPPTKQKGNNNQTYITNENYDVEHLIIKLMENGF